jgi:sugar lactone lactonase YvrE
MFSFAAYPTGGNVTSAPVARIGGGRTAISIPSGVALDQSGRIYVANNATNTITEYAAYPTGIVTSAPTAIITGVSMSIGVYRLAPAR